MTNVTKEDDFLTRVNCAGLCSGHVVLVMGVERCSVCNRLMGADAFQDFPADFGAEPQVEVLG
jgi:hypothetical protein